MATDQQTPTAVEVPPSSEIPMEDAPMQTEETNPRKRQREDNDDGQEPPALDNDHAEPSSGEVGNAAGGAAAAEIVAAAASDGTQEEPKLSKNQMRKLKRQKMWEERRQDRKVQRKEKRHEKTARNRVERHERAAELARAEGIDAAEALRRVVRLEKQNNKRYKQACAVPVSLIVDCDFEEYMFDNELVSLGAQITRSYSMNKQGDYQAHVLVSSWGGKLKERFETVMKNTHKQWRGISFIEGDFVEAGKVAWDIMHGPRGGKLCPALGGDEKAERQQPDDEKTIQQDQPDDIAADEEAGPDTEAAPEPANETSTPDKPIPEFTTDSVIYLSADSPNTLDRLEPNTSYVIGGLVDRNREKLLCQRRAEGKGIQTAKLPIGEYLQMASRQVLATNHVVEIMCKWLECGDWGKAFMEVIPKRKGGQLKGEDGEEEEYDEVADADAEEQGVHAGEVQVMQEGEDGSTEVEKQAEDTAPAVA